MAIVLKREIEISNAKIIMTRGELGYGEVLNDFATAEFIYIVTYNISRNNTILLDRLNGVSHDTEIKIFTNIPSRYDNYYYRWNSRRARDQINVYLANLDPEQFGELFSSYFIFNNHAKMIMTNNIAYIGSANFSSESANNIEAGVIIEDELAIQQIKSIIDAEIHTQAEPYYALDIFPLIFQARELENIRVILSENIWGVWDIHGIEAGQYYNGANINFEINILETFENLKDDIDNTLSELTQDIHATENTIIELSNLEVERLLNVRDIISSYEVEQEVKNFLGFNESDFINEKMKENAIFMTEDVLDEYIDEFTQQAFEIKDMLATDAHDGFIEFESFLTTAIQIIMESLEELRVFINDRIDNT